MKVFSLLGHGRESSRTRRIPFRGYLLACLSLIARRPRITDKQTASRQKVGERMLSWGKQKNKPAKPNTNKVKNPNKSNKIERGEISFRHKIPKFHAIK